MQMTLEAKKSFVRGMDYELDRRLIPPGVTADNDEVTAIMGRVMPLHEEVLNLAKPRTYAEVIRNVIRATEVVFAVTIEPEPKDIGVVVQTVKTVTIGGESLKVVMIAMRGVLPDYQKYGVGTDFVVDAIKRHEPHGFTGRTPNPNIFRSYKRVPQIGEISPIDKPYSPKMRTFMAAFLSDAELSTTDLNTGRCIGVYPRGAERLVTYDPNDREMNRILKIMTGPRIGANLEEGDGVRYWASVIPDPTEQNTLKAAA